MRLLAFVFFWCKFVYRHFEYYPDDLCMCASFESSTVLIVLPIVEYSSACKYRYLHTPISGFGAWDFIEDYLRCSIYIESFHDQTCKFPYGYPPTNIDPVDDTVGGIRSNGN